VKIVTALRGQLPQRRAATADHLHGQCAQAVSARLRSNSHAPLFCMDKISRHARAEHCALPATQ
jgi:hypothetical protein